jgi:hypothetical protein
MQINYSWSLSLSRGNCCQRAGCVATSDLFDCGRNRPNYAGLRLGWAIIETSNDNQRAHLALSCGCGDRIAGVRVSRPMQPPSHARLGSAGFRPTLALVFHGSTVEAFCRLRQAVGPYSWRYERLSSAVDVRRAIICVMEGTVASWQPAVAQQAIAELV